MDQFFRFSILAAALALSGCESGGKLSDFANDGYDLMASGYENLKKQFSTEQDALDNDAAPEQAAPEQAAPEQAVNADAFTVVGVLAPYGVIDGDTINLSGKVVLLYGIDAPELPQKCAYGQQQFQCGVIARDALIDFTSGRKVSCLQKATDRYQRLIAQCFVNGVDISLLMVRSGLAVAFRQHGPDYAEFEQAARKNKTGIWQSTFERPVDWRKSHNMQ